MVVLDTDHVSILERGAGVEAQRLLARLAKLRATDVVTTIVSFEEQTRGWLSYVARAKTITLQIEAYGRLRRHLDNYRRILVIDFDQLSATHFRRLLHSRTGVGTMDLKIAAIALAHNATLLTRNLRDFRQVPSLRVEDWTT